MRALLIVNPHATTTTPAGRDRLAHALGGAVALTVAHTTHRGHAAELARSAHADGMDVIVAHGGDGPFIDRDEVFDFGARKLDHDGPG